MNFTHNEIGLDWIVLVENMSWQWISTVLLFQQRVTTLQPKSKKLKFYLTLQQQIWSMEWRTMQFMKSIWNLNKPKWDKGFYPLTPKNVGIFYANYLFHVEWSWTQKFKIYMFRGENNKIHFQLDCFSWNQTLTDSQYWIKLWMHNMLLFSDYQKHI